jgi:hypothetical protein
MFFSEFHNLIIDYKYYNKTLFIFKYIYKFFIRFNKNMY